METATLPKLPCGSNVGVRTSPAEAIGLPWPISPILFCHECHHKEDRYAVRRGIRTPGCLRRRDVDSTQFEDDLGRHCALGSRYAEYDGASGCSS